MKKSKKPLSPRNFANDFVRAALVSGVVAALAKKDAPRFGVADIRCALQAGAVLACATVAADALQQKRYLPAILAAGGAAASVYALQRLLPDDPSVPAFPG